MLLLDVPFIPDEPYLGLLQECRHHLHSVHFSLFLPGVPDGRHANAAFRHAALAPMLSQLPGVKKYGLLNSRFHPPSFYSDRTLLADLIRNIDGLIQSGNLDGITIVDFYLLQALSDYSPAVAGELEAVPGINCMLDSFDRITSALQTIERSHFRLPEKITLDRSLNRKPATLNDIAKQCRENFPHLKLSLLANEGCLARCPFKLSHDAQIAFANTGLAPNTTFALNSSLGCIRIIEEHPEEIFRSPFIRPEDIGHYDGIIDIIKLCGRTIGPEFLRRIVKAYTARRYAGNLLDLLDTLDWLAGKVMVANEQLPADFFERLSTCDRICSSCSWCGSLYQKMGRAMPLHLKDLRQDK